MAGRPCIPDADTKRLWQMLLPGVPFPACGDPGESDAAVAAPARPSPQPAGSTEPVGEKRPDGG